TALLDGKNTFDAIKFAHAAAAISVTRKGAQPSIPSRQETLDFLFTQQN
ncbi:ribokinase, partial [Escherichia coli]|nr:ribokinase [Escherichia coli]